MMDYLDAIGFLYQKNPTNCLPLTILRFRFTRQDSREYARLRCKEPSSHWNPSLWVSFTSLEIVDRVNKMIRKTSLLVASLVLAAVPCFGQQWAAKMFQTTEHD